MDLSPPEMNPIEHIWGVLKRKVERHDPSSKEQLKHIVSKEWQNIAVGILVSNAIMER